MVSDTYSKIARRNAATFDHIEAFTGKVHGSPDLSTPNSAYWERMDTMVTLARRYGITMVLVPADTATGFGTTYCMRMVRNNGSRACINYGRFLGNRYKDSSNIIWMNGNDYATAAPYGDDDQYVGGISDGIRSVAPAQLQTVELIPGVGSTIEAYSYMGTAWPARIDLDQAYPGTTDPSYAIGLKAYAASPIKPVFMGEGLYEGNPGWTTFRLRKQTYWTMVTGCYGQLYGNETVYPFRSGWQAALSTVAVAEVGYWASLFKGLPWSTLTPDTTNSYPHGRVLFGDDAGVRRVGIQRIAGRDLRASQRPDPDQYGQDEGTGYCPLVRPNHGQIHDRRRIAIPELGDTILPKSG